MKAPINIGPNGKPLYKILGWTHNIDPAYDETFRSKVVAAMRSVERWKAEGGGLNYRRIAGDTGIPGNKIRNYVKMSRKTAEEQGLRYFDYLRHTEIAFLVHVMGLHVEHKITRRPL